MADKKISELPLINTISGSTIIPLVHDGITVRMGVDRFSLFTSQFSATTGSNIFIGNQTINGNLSVSGTSTLTGNTSVGGNLVVNGKLTAQEVHTEITSASIIFESGSTIFGNSADDTHQFTGIVSINGISIGAGVINDFTASQLANDTRMLYITGALNAFTASQIGKDGTLSQVTSSLGYFYETTSSLHAFTSSQLANDTRMLYISGALNSFTASQIGKDNTLAIVTSSLNAFTASQIGKDGTLGLVTSSLNDFTQSQIGKDGTLGLVTSSLNAFTQSQIGKDGTLAVVTSSLNAFTQSQIGKDFTLSIVTSSLNNYTSSVIGQANTLSVFTSSINAFTGSQLGKDLTLSIVTSSIDAHILKQATQTGSQDLVNYNISVYTGSQNVINSSVDAHILKQATQTGSQDLVNLGISVFTGSARFELNSIEAYTSSLKNAISVSGTNVQIIGDLNVNKLNVQYISSSVLVTSGSNTFGDQSTDKHEFTGSVYLQNSLFLGNEVLGNAGLNAFTGSQIGKDFTLSVVTSSIDTHILKQAAQTGSQDLVNYNISVYTGSQNVINNSVNSHILAQSTQTGSQDLVNYNISVYTGSQNVINTSVNSHILVQSTQTGSQDLVNLGISTFTGSLRSEVNLIEAYTASLKGAAIVSSSQQITNYYKFAETASANTKFYGNVTASGNISVGTDSFTSPNGADRFVGVYSGQDSSIILQDSVETWEMYMNDDLYFTTGSTSPKNVVSLRRGTGNVEVNEGNLVVSKGNIVVGTAGKGIDFSATSNGSGTTSSEILNDYEEGTFTPVIVGGSSAGTATYTDQNGKYTKIGNVVYFRADVIWSGHTGLGTLKITGLPFTTSQNYQAIGSVRFNQSGTASHYIGGGFIYQTQFELQQSPVGGGTPISFDVTSAGDIRVSGFYFA